MAIDPMREAFEKWGPPANDFTELAIFAAGFAAGVEAAAKLLDALGVYESDNGKDDSNPNDCAEKIRALLVKP
jgi:hypothetical protein